MPNAPSNFTIQEKRAELGWTEVHDRKHREYYDAMFKYGEEKAGEKASNSRQWHETPEGRAWGERLQAGIKEYRKTHKPDTPDISDAITGAWNDTYLLGRQVLMAVVTR